MHPSIPKICKSWFRPVMSTIPHNMVDFDFSTSSTLRRPLSEYAIISAPDAFLGSVFSRTNPSMGYNPKIAYCHSPLRRPELTFANSVGSIHESSESLQCLLLPQKTQEIWKLTASKVQTPCSCNPPFYSPVHWHYYRWPESNWTILQRSSWPRKARRWKNTYLCKAYYSQG